MDGMPLDEAIVHSIEQCSMFVLLLVLFLIHPLAVESFYPLRQ